MAKKFQLNVAFFCKPLQKYLLFLRILLDSLKQYYGNKILMKAKYN